MDFLETSNELYVIPWICMTGALQALKFAVGLVHPVQVYKTRLDFLQEIHTYE